MKKLGLICATLLAGLSLSACNNMASQSHKASSSSSSTRVVKKHKHHKKQSNKKSSSSTVSSESSLTSDQSSNIQSTPQANQGTKQQVQNTQTSNSPSSDPHLADGTDVYDLPLSDPRNPDSYKQGELMDISGDPNYQNPDGSVNAAGQAKISSIEGTFHQPQE